MPRPCSVCSHPDRADIDKALAVEPTSNRKVAARFHLSEQAVRRHRMAHLPAKLAKAREAVEVAESDNLLQQIRALRSKSLQLLAKAEDAGDIRTALAAVREARACVELLLEVEGELDRRSVVNVRLSPEWVEVRTIVLDSLTPYPDARQAVSGALISIEGGGRAS